MHRTLVAALAILGALALASPAVAASGQAAALKRELGPGAKVATHGETGQVRFVGAPAGRALPSGAARGASAREAARAFLGSHGKAFGLGDPARDLRVEKSHAFPGGRSSVRFQQLLDGIPVVGGELVVTLNADRDVLAATGEVLPGSVSTTPAVTSAAARQEAIAAVAAERGVPAARLRGSPPQLWAYDARLLGGPGVKRPTLVWRLEVEGLAIDDLVLVDATHGYMALRVEQIEHAKTRTVCDANNTVPVPAGAYPCTAPVATEADPPGAGDDADVEPAFEFAGQTYDFFFARFQRDSLDDAGLPLRSTVDFCQTAGNCPFANAFWDGEQMVYGDGFASADDVVGHELTHGVTDFSAGLFYYYQSGAINESMSDVFGEFIDQLNTDGDDSAAAKWELAEDISGGPIRDMQNPELFGDPDSMTSGNYDADPLELDTGGVHTNSGVNNKAAFLMTDGGTFGGRTVTGLGLSKVALVYYETLTTLLTSGSDYADLATALPAACDAHVGDSSGITAADCGEVRDAVAAVEMSTDPPAAPAPEAAVCPSGQVPSDLFFDDFEAPATNTDWNGSGWGFDVGYAHSGATFLFGPAGGAAGTTQAFMTRSIAIPAGATTAYMRFDHAYEFQDSGGGRQDGGVLEISTDDGGSFTDVGALLTDVGYNGAIAAASNPLNGRPAFVSKSNGYRASRVTLTSLRGESVRFRFRVGTNAGVADLGWIVDDVHIYTCAVPPPPPDSDGDGVPDASDACPAAPGTLPNGCAPSGGGADPGSGSTGGGSTGGGGTTAATLASAKLRSCKRSGTGKRARVRCTLRGFGAVQRATVTVKRKGKTVGKKTLRPSSSGVLSFKPKKALRKGTYKVTIVLRDADGNKRTLKKSFKVK